MEEGAVESKWATCELTVVDALLVRKTPWKVPFETGSEDMISSNPSESGISVMFEVRVLRLLVRLDAGRDGSGVAILEAATD